MSKGNLTIYNLSVKIELADTNLSAHLQEFLNAYYTSKEINFAPTKNYPGAPPVKEPEPKVYASREIGVPIWYLHHNQFKHFVSHLRNVDIEIMKELEITDERSYAVFETDFQLRDNWRLRDNQIEPFEFLMTLEEGTRLLPLTMGSGKTFLSMAAVAKWRQRLGVVILPQFMDKWVSDITEIHQAKVSDVMVVRGRDQVASIVELARSGALPDYYVFSMTTLQNYISAYEKDPELTEEMYGCKPIELFPLLGIGILLIDETHMSFHALYKIIIHTNVKRFVAMSGTLVSTDDVVNRCYNVVYPQKDRYGDKMIKKYIDIYPTKYKIDPRSLNFIRTSFPRSTMYAHTAFETSIIRNKILLPKYIDLIVRNLRDYFDPDYIKGDKAAIYVATIKLATLLQERISEEYPHLKVCRYTGEDCYEEMLKSDIICTTPNSLSTAIDVKDNEGNRLRVVIQTVSILSPQNNLQTLGRLRQIEDRDVKFVYLYSENLKQQVGHHYHRMKLFRPLANGIYEKVSNFNM